MSLEELLQFGLNGGAIGPGRLDSWHLVQVGSILHRSEIVGQLLIAVLLEVRAERFLGQATPREAQHGFGLSTRVTLHGGQMKGPRQETAAFNPAPGTKALGQSASNLAPDLLDAQGNQEAIECRLTRLLDLGTQGLGRLLAPTFELSDGFVVEIEDFLDRGQQTLGRELSDRPFSQPFDTQRGARCQVDHAALALGWTVKIDAEAVFTAFKHAALAAGTDIGPDELGLFTGARFGHRAKDLRDDIAGASHVHHVAHLEAELLDVARVMQSGMAHRGAAQLHGLEGGAWRQPTCAADLNLDRE